MPREACGERERSCSQLDWSFFGEGAGALVGFGVLKSSVALLRRVFESGAPGWCHCNEAGQDLEAWAASVWYVTFWV